MNTLAPAVMRDARPSELGQLAKLWFDGWQDAHARIVPAELVPFRSLQSFDERLRRAKDGPRVAIVAGNPVGFYLLKGTELYQFYVSSTARGRGIAAIMMCDAEARFSDERRAYRLARLRRRQQSCREILREVRLVKRPGR